MALCQNFCCGIHCSTSDLRLIGLSSKKQAAQHLSKFWHGCQPSIPLATVFHSLLMLLNMNVARLTSSDSVVAVPGQGLAHIGQLCLTSGRLPSQHGEYGGQCGYAHTRQEHQAYKIGVLLFPIHSDLQPRSCHEMPGSSNFTVVCRYRIPADRLFAW